MTIITEYIADNAAPLLAACAIIQGIMFVVTGNPLALIFGALSTFAAAMCYGS